MKFLPVVSLFLLSWSGTTFADQDGPVVVVGEGNDVILPCSLSTKENIELKAFTWIIDGQKEVFSYNAGIHSNNGRPGQVEQFKGRVSYFRDKLKNGDASIKITNTMAADSGNYSCVFAHLQSETRHIQLVVRLAVKVVVREDSDAILPCSLSTTENIERELFDWKKDGGMEVFMYDGKVTDKTNEQFKSRVSHFPDELKYGNASIKITKTKVNDSGDYTCIFPHLQPERRFLIQLVVGAAPEPYIRTLEETKDRTVLQCEAHGVPQPEVEWRDSSGNIVPAEEPQVSKRGDNFYVTLKTTVTRTDHYSCVATQKTINHTIYAERPVYIHGHSSGVHGSDLTSRKVMIAVAVGVLAELLFL